MFGCTRRLVPVGGQHRHHAFHLNESLNGLAHVVLGRRLDGRLPGVPDDPHEQFVRAREGQRC
ncbi:hypothetical protein, partial [Streptosporangium lutulentum]|uniref:hypothetical protein n=1 Tax=Streptosporangium lutulentum TaxID=1461250 RepID=UPI00364130E6